MRGVPDEENDCGDHDSEDAADNDGASMHSPSQHQAAVGYGLDDESDLDEQVDRDLDEEQPEAGRSASSGQRTQSRTRQPAHGAAAAARAAGGEQQKKSAYRKPSAAERSAFPVFVCGTLSAPSDGPVMLRALGTKATNDELALTDQSLFSIYEWLAEANDIPPSLFQRAISEVPGATCKKLKGVNVWRAFKVEERLDELRKLLNMPEMRAVLAKEHLAALGSEESARTLTKEFAAKLIALRKKCSKHTGRTDAAADRRRAAAGPDDDDGDDNDEERRSPEPYPPSLAGSSTLLATRPRHSERTHGSYREIIEAQDGEFLSPTGTGQTKRAALEVLDKVHRSLRKHQQAHPEQPSFDYDRMRAMELASKYPKIAKSVHAEMQADLLKRAEEEL